MNRWLLEFDVRVAREQYVGRHWDETSRGKHLLRPEIDWPLSVDKGVWPSVFFLEGLKDTTKDTYATVAIDPSIGGGAYAHDLDRLRAHYDAHRSSRSGGVFTAVELLTEKVPDGIGIPYELQGGIQCAITLEPVSPARIPEGSTFLGFDVATAGRLSGVSGFEYSVEEVGRLAPVWGPRLNSTGLFSSLDDAVAFREIAERRIPDEAPFWVYGLWRLRDY